MHFWRYIKCKHWANAHFWFIYIDIQLQFRQIPMTAVAVEYRPAMDSCMVGIRLYKTCALSIRLYRTCALTALDSSDPGEYPEVGVGIF